MTRFRLLSILLVLPVLCVGLLAQAKPAPASPPPGVVIGDVAYPLPLAQRDKFRDLQHEDDQIEIENQRMQIKIEQNRLRQEQLRAAERGIAYDFAVEQKIDLTLYELDPADIKFRKKAKK